MSFFFLLVLWLGICVELAVEKITILPPAPLLFIFFVPTHNSLFNTRDSNEISVRLKLVWLF